MRGATIVAVTVLVLSGVATGAAPEPPLADAGLDQWIDQGETVMLDATGSRDPDGDITAYAWTIETPRGSTVTPACATCAWTRFTPGQVGIYRVDLTVTDDAGASRSDHLFVTVRPASRSGRSAGPASAGTGAGVANVPSSAGSAGSDGGRPGGSAGGPGPGVVSTNPHPTRINDITTNPGQPSGGSLETNPGRDREIWTYVTPSPLGTDVGGVTYVREPNGEVSNSIFEMLEHVGLDI